MPDSSQADAQEAVSLIEQRRVAEARLAIGRAISERDDVPEYYLIQGQIELVAGAKDNAFVAFKNALDLDATNPLALQQVARLGLEVGQIRDAIKAVDTLLVLDPRNANALVMRGLIDLVQNDFEEALEAAERLRRFDPTNEGGVILEARARLMLGDPEKSLSLISEFEEARGVTLGTARNRVEIGRYLGEPELMEGGFEFILRETPNDLSVKVDYANFLFKRGKIAEAVEQLVTTITTEGIALPDVAAAADLAREYDAERQLADRLSNEQSDLSAPTRVLLARLFIDADLFRPAASILGPAGTPDAKATDAWLAFRSGDPTKAERAAQEVLSEDKENCIALFVSANIDFDKGRFRDAIRKGQQAAAQCPREKEAWVITGRAFAANEDIPNARRVFRDGIDNLPQYTPMTKAYTDWLLQNGAGREAVAAARGLTRASPALISGWRLYENICERTGASCAERARVGFADAEILYGVDLVPGERPATDLLGRLSRK